jgi:hypothetical protein
MNVEFLVQILPVFFNGLDRAMNGSGYPPVVVTRGN